jgi:hypothetical protein
MSIWSLKVCSAIILETYFSDQMVHPDVADLATKALIKVEDLATGFPSVR